MASLDLDINPSRYQIRAYQPGSLRINDTVYTHSIIISPDELIPNWSPRTIHELTADTLTPVIDLKPDVLLIGTGATQVLLTADHYGHLINLGIGVEVMDTGAACRTFNALSAESRRVVAALLVE